MDLDDLIALNGRVDAHRGCNNEWLQRHERAAALAVRLGAEGVDVIAPCLVRRMSDDRNLLVAWDHVAARSGATPGPDGLTSADFPTTQAQCDGVRRIRDALRNGEYEHGPTRCYQLPKRSGGHRTIEVPDLADRLVARGMVQVLQPLLDPLFDEQSVGFRPGRGPWHALAIAESLIRVGRPAALLADIRDAFGSCPQERLLQLVGRYLRSADAAELVARVVRTPDGRGLRQGSPLSPLLLNLCLHHHLDRVWRVRHRGWPLVRYVDDIAVFTADRAQARAAHDCLQELLLPAGFQLKRTQETPQAIDLTDQTAEWLGFRIGWADEDELEVWIAERAWDSLENAVHEAGGGPHVLRQRVEPWLAHMGPAYGREDRREVYRRITELLGTAGVRHQPRQSRLAQVWAASDRRWSRLRRRFLPAVDLV